MDNAPIAPNDTSITSLESAGTGFEGELLLAQAATPSLRGLTEPELLNNSTEIGGSKKSMTLAPEGYVAVEEHSRRTLSDGIWTNLPFGDDQFVFYEVPAGTTNNDVIVRTTTNLNSRVIELEEGTFVTVNIGTLGNRSNQLHGILVSE